MKLKKLISVLTLAAFSGQLITGCTGNGGSGNTSQNNSKNAKWQSPAKIDYAAGMSDHRLWANITHTDWSDRPSNLYFVNDNYSSNDVYLVGCTDGVENHLESEIPNKHMFPRTSKFDSKWSAYADGNGAIYDPAHMKENYLRMNDGSMKDSSSVCYYAISHPEVNDILYFKVVNSAYTVTYGSGGNAHGQPDSDQLELSKSPLGQAVQNGQITAAKLSGGDHYAWASQKDAQLSLDDYMDKFLNNSLQSSLILANQDILALKASSGSSLDGAGTVIDSMAKIRTLLGELKINKDIRNQLILRDLIKDYYVEFYSGWPDTAGYKIYLRIGAAPGDPLAYTYKLSNAAERSEFIQDYGFEMTDSNAIIPPSRVQLEARYMGKGLGKIEEVNEYLETLSVDEAETIGAISNELPTAARALAPKVEQSIMRAQIGEITAGETIVPAELEGVAGALEPAAGAAALGEASVWTTGNVVAASFAGVMTGAIIGLSIYEALAPYWNPTSPRGQTRATINHLSLDVPSAAEVAAWNQKHPDSPIKANTVATTLDPTDPYGGNNSLRHSMKFTFADPAIDSQVGNEIDLAALSTPWLRNDSSEDRFLGNVSSSSSEFGSAVIAMSVSNISEVTPIKDATQEYNLSRFANMGVPELATDTRLDAPTYSVAKVVNTKLKKTIYATGMNDGLLGSRNGLVRLNGIEGIALNDDQKLP